MGDLFPCIHFQSINITIVTRCPSRLMVYGSTYTVSRPGDWYCFSIATHSAYTGPRLSIRSVISVPETKRRPAAFARKRFH
mgnify:CR=1 FL=1